MQEPRAARPACKWSACYQLILVRGSKFVSSHALWPACSAILIRKGTWEHHAATTLKLLVLLMHLPPYTRREDSEGSQHGPPFYCSVYGTWYSLGKKWIHHNKALSRTGSNEHGQAKLWKLTEHWNIGLSLWASLSSLLLTTPQGDWRHHLRWCLWELREFCCTDPSRLSYLCKAKWQDLPIIWYN